MGRKKRGDPVHGWVIVDKPPEITSTAVVGVVRRIFNAQKAGHGGTLDPLATGLLPIALGEATKTVSYVMEGTKNYRFKVKWGEERSTDDAEGEITQSSTNRPDRDAIAEILPKFTGVIEQVPPQFSAVKVDAKRAYDIARKGKYADIQSREVIIQKISLVNCPDADHAEFDVACGKGTYVRALARDFGRELGCFGHVSSLRRTRVGPFAECDAIALDKLQEISHKGAGAQALHEFLCPVETALDDIPALAIGSAEVVRVRHGQPVILRGRDAPISEPTVLVKWQGKPVAIAAVEGGVLRVKRAFNFDNRS